MPQLDPTLWRDMMEYLRERHAPICRQWFERIEPIRLASGLLEIHTPNVVHQTYLQNKCRAQFTEAAQQVTGQLVAVRFVHERSKSRPVADADDPPVPPADPPVAGAAEADSPAPAPAHQGAQTARRLNGKPGPAARPALASTTAPRAQPRPIPTPPGVAGLGEDAMLISPDNSFDTFVPGPNNDLAYACCLSVAKDPAKDYNPLFLHSGVGLGKTHLLQAICQHLLDANPEMNILYVSCDAFMNQFLQCVQSGQMKDFRTRYRHVDMLVIDDIHFLGNRERSQEEFFHTFNELYQSNRQIVLSSDAPPHEIPNLEDRLVSRFQWGMVAMLTPPTFETRVGILKAKAQLRQVAMPDEVAELIASKLDSNARELEGAITAIQAHAALHGKTIDLALAREALGEPQIEPQSNQATLQTIIETVTHFYGIKLSDLQSRRRHKSVTEPRQVCMFLARKKTRFSLEEIGGYFGGRDHTTVMHSVRIVDERMGKDDDFASQVELLDHRVGRPNLT